LAIEMLYISHEFFPLIVQLIKSWKCGKFKAKYSKLCSLHQRLKNIFPPHMRAPIYGKWSKSLSAFRSKWRQTNRHQFLRSVANELKLILLSFRLKWCAIGYWLGAMLVFWSC